MMKELYSFSQEFGVNDKQCGGLNFSIANIIIYIKKKIFFNKEVLPFLFIFFRLKLIFVIRKLSGNIFQILQSLTVNWISCTLMKNYFEGHKQFYESIPQEKRLPYLLQMLQNPHQSGTPYNFSDQYPHEQDFYYQKNRIHYYHTKEIQQPKALVFYIHGLYSYGGAYAYFGNNIVKSIQSTMVYTCDFVNCGKSLAGYKGYMESFEFILCQAQAFVNHITQKYNGQNNKPKLFLVGHSFGGTVAFRMSIRNPKKFDGIIFLVPALREIKDYQKIMKKIGKFIGYILPKLRLNAQRYDDFRYDMIPPYVANDLFYNDRNIAGSIAVLLSSIQQTSSYFKEFDCPYILFQAGSDKLVDIFAPLDLQLQCKTVDKRTIYMKGMWHGIFYEKEIVGIMEMCIDWLSKRV